MTPSAPFMQQCVTCEYPVDDYTADFIHFVENNYGDVEDCQNFLKTYYSNPSTVFKQCMLCLRSKWRKMKSENLKRIGNDQKIPSKNDQKFQEWYWYRVAIIAMVMIIVGCFSSYCFTSAGDNSVSEDKLKSTISKLKTRFPSLQHKMLKKIGGAFLRLKTPGEPFVFLLLHDDKNKKTTDCLASYTSVVAKQNIFTNTTKSLWMNASEWAQYSEQDNQDLLYEKLITPLKENEVLVLENLQDLPWSLAKSFHHLCDSENPQIAKAMYILELKVNDDDLEKLTDGGKLMTAERAMTFAWLEAPNSYRAALIARLTSFVDAVLLESDEECSNNVFGLQSEGSFIRISP